MASEDAASMGSGMATPGRYPTAETPVTTEGIGAGTTTTAPPTDGILKSEMDGRAMGKWEAPRYSVLATLPDPVSVEEGGHPPFKLHRFMQDAKILSERVPEPPSVSETVDIILAALQQPTPALDPECHGTDEYQREMPAFCYFRDSVTATFGKRAQDALRDGGIGTAYPADPSTSTPPSVLTLMRMMAEQIAAQGEAIAELKAKNRDSESRGADVRELLADVHKLKESAELHTSTIEQLKEEKSFQRQTSVGSTEDAEAVQELKREAAEQASTIDVLKATNEAESLEIKQVEDRNSALDDTVEQLKEEIVSLRDANSRLESKVESVFKMQGTHSIAVPGRRGPSGLLEGFFRVPPSNVNPASTDPSISGAETYASNTPDDIKALSKSLCAEAEHPKKVDSDLSARFDSLQDRVTARIDEMSAKFEAERNHNGGIWKQLQYTDQRVDTLANSVPKNIGVKVQVDSVSAAVNKLMTKAVTKESFSKLKSAHDQLVMQSETRFEQIGSELSAYSKYNDCRLDNISNDIDEMRRNLEGQAGKIQSVRETQNANRKAVDKLQNSSGELQFVTEGLQTQVAALQCAVDDFQDDYAPIGELNGIQYHIADLNDTLDRYDNDASFFRDSVRQLEAKTDQLTVTHGGTDHLAAEKISTLKSDINEIFSRLKHLSALKKQLKFMQENSSAAKAAVDQLTTSRSKNNEETRSLITNHHDTLVNKIDSEISKLDIDALHQAVKTIHSRLDCVGKFAESTKEELAQDKESHSKVIREIHERANENFKILSDKIESDITKLCFHNSLEPVPEDEFDVEETPSPDGTTCSNEALFDPYGNDWQNRNFNENDAYFGSYEEEDRRCGKCGYEHESDTKLGDCRGEHYQSDGEDGDGKVEESQVLIEY